MRQHEAFIAERKRSLLAELPLSVLEIGPGPGVNLSYYRAGTQWTGVEPNPHMQSRLVERAAELGMSVDVRTGSAESIDLDDESVDAVVCTLVLCSVPNPAGALAEVRRVLRPGGKFVFVEHIAAPEGTFLRATQRLARPLWRLIGDGCNPDRETSTTLEQAGFSSLAIEPFRIPWKVVVPIVAPHILGTATK